MSSISPHAKDAFLLSVEDSLKERVFKALKGPLMKIAEEEIDKAVREAVKSMNIDINMYIDREGMRETIEILLRRSNG